MNEPVDIEFRINGAELEVQSRRAVNSILGVGDAGRRAESRVSSLEGSIKKLIAGLAGGAVLKEFARQIVNVRAEIQALEASFEVLLGNKQKADAMLAAIKDYAVVSPLSLMGVSNAAQTLLSFNVEAERVIPILKQIGDISMGNEQKFASLILAFSQMSSTGRLMGQDLNQMINAGFNPLQTLAEKTGKSIADLKKEMEQGAISAEMVADAFRSATDEGGKFHEMTEKQAEGIKGLQAQLGGAVQDALNDMGKASEGVIAAAIKGTTSLVQNYEKIGKVIVALIATYGAYRAALIATSIAQAGFLTLHMQMGVVMARLNVIARTLATTLATNSYAMIAAVLVGVVASMWALGDSTTAAERALKNYNERKKAAAQAEEEHKARIDALIATVKDEAEATYKRIQALKDLKAEYPTLFGEYDIETLKLADILSLKKQIAELDGKGSLGSKRDEADRIKAEIAELEAKRDRTPRGTREGGATVIRIENQLDLLREKLKLLTGDIHKQEGAMWEATTPLAIQAAALKNNIDALKEANAKLDERIALQKELNESGTPLEYKPTMTDEAQFNFNRQKIEELEALLKTKTEAINKDALVKNKAYWEDVKKNAEAARDKLLPGEGNWNALTAKILEAEGRIAQYDIKKEKEGATAAARSAAERLKAAERIAEREKQLAKDVETFNLESEQRTLDLQKDNAEKRFQQIDLDYKKELRAIREFQAERLKEQQKAAKDIWVKEKGTSDGFDFQTFDRSALPAGLKDGDIEAEAQRREGEAARAATEKRKKEVDALAAKYADYAQQRLNIEQQFNDDLAAMYDKNGSLLKGFTEANVEELKLQMVEALATLDDEFSTVKTSIETLFGDMASKSADEMRRIAQQARDMVDFVQAGEWDEEKAATHGINTEEQFKRLNAEWAKSPDILEAVIAKILNLSSAADDSETAFKKMAAGLRQVLGSGGQSELKEGLDKMADGLRDVTALTGLFADSLRNIGEASGNETFTRIADGISSVMDAANKTMQGAQAGAAFGPLGAAVGAALGLVSSITGALAAGREQARRNAELTREMIDQQYVAEHELNRLYRDRYEWSKKIGETNLEYAKRLTEELARQKGEIDREADDYWGKLQNSYYYTEWDDGKRSGWLGDWSAKDVNAHWTAPKSLAGKTEKEIHDLYLRGVLTEEAERWYLAWMKANDEKKEVAEREEEAAKNMLDILAGATKDSVVESIVEGFKVGKRSAADFADTFNDLMTNALTSALRTMTDEKMKEWYVQFAEWAKDGWADEEIAAARESFNRTIEDIGTNADIMEQIANFGWKAQGSEKGMFETMSEETGSALLGQFTAIRVHTGDISGLLTEMELQSTALVNHLEAIEKNTFDAAAELRAVNKHLKRIETEGVMVK